MAAAEAIVVPSYMHNQAHRNAFRSDIPDRDTLYRNRAV
jgi:hypothetical protein